MAKKTVVVTDVRRGGSMEPPKEVKTKVKAGSRVQHLPPRSYAPPPFARLRVSRASRNTLVLNLVNKPPRVQPHLASCAKSGNDGGVPSVQGPPIPRETPKVVKAAGTAAGTAAKVSARAGAKVAKVGTKIGGKTTKVVGGSTVAVVVAVGKFSLKRVVPWGSVLARRKRRIKNKPERRPPLPPPQTIVFFFFVVQRGASYEACNKAGLD